MTTLRMAFAAILLSAGSAAAVPVVTDDWDYDRNYDNFDDSLSTVAWTEQSEGLNRIRVQVRCDAFQGLSAAVSFPQYIAAAATPVRYRVDDGEIVTETWYAAEDDRAMLVAPNPETFAWRMIKGRRLFIEAQKDRGDPMRLTFTTGGADAEIYRVMRDCNVYDDRLVDDIPLFGDFIGGALDPRKPGKEGEYLQQSKEEKRQQRKTRKPNTLSDVFGGMFGRDKDKKD